MIEQNKQADGLVTMPALALRGITVFPNLLLHFDVGRESSIRALEEAMAGGREVFLVTQRDPSVDKPKQEDLYSVGTVANVKQILHLPESGVRVMVEGSGRGRLVKLISSEPALMAQVEVLSNAPVSQTHSSRTEALIRQL